MLGKGDPGKPWIKFGNTSAMACLSARGGSTKELSDNQIKRICINRGHNGLTDAGMSCGALAAQKCCNAVLGNRSSENGVKISGTGTLVHPFVVRDVPIARKRGLGVGHGTLIAPKH